MLGAAKHPEQPAGDRPGSPDLAQLLPPGIELAQRDQEGPAKHADKGAGKQGSDTKSQWTRSVRRLLARHSTSGPGVGLGLFKRENKVLGFAPSFRCREAELPPATPLADSRGCR
jgi:hypothetical protein